MRERQLEQVMQYFYQQKRIDAIGSIKELGMGFTLATHDLEIRGAGELLGSEQSGHMQ